MEKVNSDNCMICAEEFSLDQLKSVALSTFNITKFKICADCLGLSNPEEDYAEVKQIIKSFSK